MKVGEIRIEIEYPIFRKIKKEGGKTSLEEVREILSGGVMILLMNYSSESTT